MPKLGKADYAKYISSRAVLPPQLVYKYTAISSLKAIIHSSSLRFRSPKDFNDPLDSQWNVFWALATPEARKYEASLVRQALIRDDTWPANSDTEMRKAMATERRKMRSIPASRRIGWINKFVSDMVSDRSGLECAEARTNDLVRRMRILCVSETWQSSPMWAHYAENGSGVVLCFDSKKLEDGYSVPLEKVEYVEQYPDLVNANEFINHLVFGTPTLTSFEVGRRWALIKNKRWEYEREWRMMFGHEEHQTDLWTDCQYAQGSLVEVILGYRADPRAVTEVARMCTGIGVKVFRTRFDTLSHELVKMPV